MVGDRWYSQRVTGNPRQDDPSDADARQELRAAARTTGPGPLTALVILLLAAVAWLGLGALHKQFRESIVRQDERHRHEAEMAARAQRAEAQAAELERLLEARRWPEVEALLATMDAEGGNAPVVAAGRARLAAGLDDERRQALGYWLGEAEAAIDAENWDHASTALARAREQAVETPEINALTARLATRRAAAEQRAKLVAARQALERRDWDEAQRLAREVLAKDAQQPDASGLVDAALAGAARQLADRQAAAGLLERARQLDTGVFNEEALAALLEARRLDPGNAEVAKLYEKMAGYGRTLRVPEEFATIGDALGKARARDRVVIGAGVWKESLVVPVAVEVLGAGIGKTIVECAADSGSVLVVGAEGAGTRVSGVTMRHGKFDPAAERFAVVLVNGGEASFDDCQIEQGSGHGVAVIAGGRARFGRCAVLASGWDGLAVYGAGSLLEVDDCRIEENVGHGVDAWDGGSVRIAGSRLRANAGNGLLFDSAGKLVMRGNVCSENREFGAVLNQAGQAEVADNQFAKNLLGGVVVRAAAANARLTGNRSEHNEGTGIILETGVPPGERNTAQGNREHDILSQVVIPPAEEPVQENAADKADAVATPAGPADQPTAPPAQPAGTPPALPEVPRRAVIIEEP